MNDPKGDDKESLDADLRSLGQASAELSHELRNLLVAVIAQAEILASGRSKDPQATARRIHQSAISCKDLIDDVLEMARPRTAATERIDLRVLLDDVLADFVRTSGGSLLTRSLPEPAWVRGRVAALRRLILNLLRNADEAGPEAAIEIDLVLRDQRFQLSVKDEGPGVPEDISARIFEPFVTSGKASGTGLGLALSRRIAREHGGELRLAPSTSRGAVFILELPAAEARDPEVAGDEKSDEPVPLRILCIDDDESTRETYRMILGLDGHEVHCVENAGEALTAIDQGTFDAIITDLRLPDMTAGLMLDRIKELDPKLAQRLIFATGDLMNEKSRSFLDATGNPYLAKPFSIEELRLALALVTRS